MLCSSLFFQVAEERDFRHNSFMILLILLCHITIIVVIGDRPHLFSSFFKDNQINDMTHLVNLHPFVKLVHSVDKIELAEWIYAVLQ